MTEGERVRREALLDQQVAALSLWPERRDPSFRERVRAIAEKLEQLAREADATGGDALERARTWRFAGLAYQDVSVGMNDTEEDEQLMPAVVAFQKADELLRSIDVPIEKTKLDLAYGRALFRLSHGRHVNIARQARDRSVSALRLARLYSPMDVPSAEEALAAAEKGLAVLEAGSRIESQAVVSDLPPAPEQIVRERAGERLAAIAERHIADTNVMAGNIAAIRELARDLAVRTAQIGPTADGSRAGEIWRRLASLVIAIYEDNFRQAGADETKGLSIDLYTKCTSAAALLRQNVANENWVRDYERQVMRPLASDMRRHLLRNHLTIAHPVWPTDSVSRNFGAVFYSGSSHARKGLAAACRRIGLTVQDVPKGASYAAARWNGLRTSEVAVFDYIGYPSAVDRDGLSSSAANAFAATSYELGIAMALGHSVLVLSDNVENIPFDIDATPLTIHATQRNPTVLCRALDDVIYGLQRQASGSSLKVTRTWLQKRFGGQSLYPVSSPLAALDESVDQNAVKFRSFAESILGWAGDTQAQIIYPSWPGDYPDTSRPKLFHVIPFGRDWSSSVTKIAAMACQTPGMQVQYVRGDQPMTRDILRSIWGDICTSTHILVDLTGLNANVAFELGLADTLGRNTLLVSQDGPVRFPSLSRDRIHSYTLTSSGILRLRGLIRNFVESANATTG